MCIGPNLKATDAKCPNDDIRGKGGVWLFYVHSYNVLMDIGKFFLAWCFKFFFSLEKFFNQPLMLETDLKYL